MRFGEDLGSSLAAVTPEAMGGFRDDIPERAIQDALKEVKQEQRRRRSLPADVVIWLVIGMALFRDRCIQAVASHLRLVLGKRTATSGGIVQARDRLGEAPMETVFRYTADEWALRSAEDDRWRGLSLFGVDGTSLRVADSPDNDAEFGRPPHASHRGAAGYPQVRLVGLLALRSRLLRGASFGAFGTGECTLAKDLWQLLPDHSLCIVDRGFIDYGLFHGIQTSGTNRHWECRAKKNLKWEVIEHLGRGDDLVRLTISRQARKKDPSLPEFLVARAIQYQRKGFQPQWVLTSLVDADAYPANEIRVQYHERWEIELTYDEVKTHTLEREECLRSRAPERVRQEIWGVLIGYNLVRHQIERFAKDNGVHPLRVSFRNALLVVRNTCVCASTGVGSVRKLLDSMNEEMSLLILPPRRDRLYKRMVKIKMSNYERNPGRPHAAVN